MQSGLALIYHHHLMESLENLMLFGSPRSVLIELSNLFFGNLTHLFLFMQEGSRKNGQDIL